MLPSRAFACSVHSCRCSGLLHSPVVHVERHVADADAAEASVHDHAMLMVDGEYGDGPEAVDIVATKAPHHRASPGRESLGTA